MIWVVASLSLYLLLLITISYVSLHPPRVPVFFSPGAIGSPQEEVQFASGPNTLKGWWVQANDPIGVAVLSHGYLMNRSELAVVAHKLAERGCSCLLYDFRAHGRSGGTRTALGYGEADDVIAAVRFSQQRSPDLPIVLIGSSMGAAASAFAAARLKGEIKGLVLDSCYSRLPSAVLGWWRFLGGPALSAMLAPTVAVCGPMAGFNPYRVDVTHALSSLEGVEVLILHGNADNLALPHEAERNAATCRCAVHWFEKCGHSEGRWVHPDRYDEVLHTFMQRAGVAREPATS